MDLDMTSYCAREVEPMGKECEQLHIIALTEYLGLKVSIEYLDGRFVSLFLSYMLLSMLYIVNHRCWAS